MTVMHDTARAEAGARPLGAQARRPFFRRRSAIPGFGLTMGVARTVLCLVVLIPLSAVAILAAGVNGVFGVLTAWALVRYSFPGKGGINALVDLPFALPTAVAGITLATLYAPNGL